MFTQLIASWKLVISKGRDLYIVTTTQGQTVWVPKNQFDSSAESITFKVLPIGTDYKSSDGTMKKTLAERNEFIGCGKQIVKKYSAVELLDHMQAKGITPTFSMS